MIEEFKFDFVVIGSGLAGLSAVVKASDYGSVAMVTKGKLSLSSSFKAQGGIAAALGEFDNPESHLRDTLIAGRGICNYEAVKTLVFQGKDIVARLIAKGLNFDTSNGKLLFSLEGGHSAKRVLHLNGTNTGKFVTRFFIEKVKALSNVRIFEKFLAVKLLTSRSKISGVRLIDLKSGKNVVLISPVIVLATGGYSRVFKRSTNPESSMGEGIWLANSAGAQIRDMEFVQFHPTALYLKNKPAFLISEAVRGEGAYLLNINKKRFMQSYNELKELAPRDVVSQAIFNEMQNLNSDFVYLDLRHLDEKKIKRKFPNIVEFLENSSFDFRKDLIPVAPAAHYSMGGIKTDINGRTNIKGLYACGEAASSGVHGANRLASNSLLECLVFSERAILDAVNAENSNNGIFKEQLKPVIIDPDLGGLYEAVKNKAAVILEKYAGILRDEEGLKKGIAEIEKLKEKINEKQEINTIRAMAVLAIAEMILKSALLRKESRGAHLRSDFPEVNEDFQGHFVVMENRIYFEEEIENRQ